MINFYQGKIDFGILSYNAAFVVSTIIERHDPFTGNLVTLTSPQQLSKLRYIHREPNLTFSREPA